MDAVFGQRHPNRVSNPIVQKRPDADRALDPRVLPLARLGHPEMNRVIPIVSFFTQSRHEQPIGVDHHLGVARLHGKNEGMVIEIARDSGELERAFDHPKRRVAVAVHDAIGERAVVRADPHGDPALPAEPDERREALPDPVQLRRVLLVCVFDDLELFRVGVISGVDPNFFHPFRRFQGGFRFEMDIGYDRHAASALAQTADDVFQVG